MCAINPLRIHGGIVRESDPGFRAKAAKVGLTLRKYFRTTFGPKAAKAPLLQGWPKPAKATIHSDEAPLTSRIASKSSWELFSA